MSFGPSIASDKGCRAITEAICFLDARRGLLENPSGFLWRRHLAVRLCENCERADLPPWIFHDRTCDIRNALKQLGRLGRGKEFGIELDSEDEWVPRPHLEGKGKNRALDGFHIEVDPTWKGTMDALIQHRCRPNKGDRKFTDVARRLGQMQHAWKTYRCVIAAFFFLAADLL